MSAFRGKADMDFCGSPLLRSLLGVKRTWLVAAHMSAYDPKRTFSLSGISDLSFRMVVLAPFDALVPQGSLLNLAMAPFESDPF
jgi:hypothetical protein